MASAIFEIDPGTGVYGTAGDPANVNAAGGTVNCRVYDLTGVDDTQIEWRIFGTHDSGASTPAISLGGNPTGQIASFVVPAGAEQAYGIELRVNGGTGATNGDTKTSAVYVLNSHGRRPFFIGETYERNPTHAIVETLNDMSSSGGSLVTSATDGEVSSFAATDNLTLCSDGVTAGGVWRTYLAVGTDAPASGGVRLGNAQAVTVADSAGTGAVSAIVMDASDHITLGANDTDLEQINVDVPAGKSIKLRSNGSDIIDVATAGITVSEPILVADAEYVELGSTNPSQTGDIRGRYNSFSVRCRNAANNNDLGMMSSTTIDRITFGGANPTRPTTIEFDPSSGVEFRTSGNVRMGMSSSLVYVTPSAFEHQGNYINFHESVSTTPTLRVKPRSGTAVSGPTLTINSQDVTNVVSYGTAGDVVLRSGDGLGAHDSGGDLLARAGYGNGTGLDGNVAMHATPASWQAMERGMFWGDCATVPSGNPAAGVFVYAEGGAAKCRGGGGTVTTFGPAEPHCEGCGRDCVLEYTNDGEGWEIRICLWCLSDKLGLDADNITRRRQTTAKGPRRAP